MNTKCVHQLLRHLMHTETESTQLRALAQGPSTTYQTFQGYDINGYTFYTRTKDNISTNQNSGVRIDAYDAKNVKHTYYGYIEEIWELDYGPLKVPVFRCQWARLPGHVNKNGFTIVDLNQISYGEEPFVLADAITQVFYVTNPSNKRRHVVLEGKRKIVGVDNVVDEEEYHQFEELPPFGENLDIPIIADTEDPPYLRRDHDEGLTVQD